MFYKGNFMTHFLSQVLILIQVGGRKRKRRKERQGIDIEFMESENYGSSDYIRVQFSHKESK